MIAQPYADLTDEQLLALCIWREARGEMMMGKRAVGCVIRNRTNAKTFFGHDWQSVILKPYAFSSFNANDPNADKWPEDDEADWLDCLLAATMVMDGSPDVTNGALYYYSRPLTQPPHAWGPVTAAASIGNLALWKPTPPASLDAGDL